MDGIGNLLGLMARIAPKAMAAGVAVTIVASAALTFSEPVSAQPITTAEAVTRLFEQEIDPDWFAQSFLARVRLEDLAELLDGLTAEYGGFQSVIGEGRELTTRLETAEFTTTVVLDEEGRFTGLFFGQPTPVGGDLGAFVSEIAALPGQTSVLVTTDGGVMAAHQADLLLGVASAFKLLVLHTLDQEIVKGTLAWDDIAILEETHKSLPSGILQDWPAGTPLTLATLAHLMISISDNTATDILIGVVGKETLEALSPINAPFVTTGELFRLKSRYNEAMIEAWIDGGIEDRRSIVARLANDPLRADRQLSRAIPEIEWFFSAYDLCSLLAATADLPMFGINPGLAVASDWATIAYKAGSEPGVLNLSTLMTGHDGRQHCVVASWNNSEPLDNGALFPPYRGILRALGGDGE